jgi:hypothetical protein
MKTIYLLVVLSWSILVVLVERELGPMSLLGPIAELAIEIAKGLIVMGFVVAAWQWITGKRFDDPFTWIALCVSLALLIAWVPLLLPVEFGLGSGEDTVGKLIVVAILLLSILVGIVYGIVTWRLRRPAAADVASILQAGLGANQGSLAASRSSPPGLLWFTLGLLLALPLMFLAGWISYNFVDRGPVTMRTEWGGSIHAHDRIVDAATGLLITVVGWVGGVVGLRYQLNRPLAIGFILGATLLGIFFAER